jgi:hypothetical protein
MYYYKLLPREKDERSVALPILCQRALRMAPSTDDIVVHLLQRFQSSGDADSRFHSEPGLFFFPIDVSEVSALY